MKRILGFMSVLGLMTALSGFAQDAAPAPEAAPAMEMAAAAPAPVLDTGSTAWMIVATALVLFMTVPALGLFYGGLVRRKNVLSILMQSFITLAVVSVVWVIAGYSLAFSDGGELIPGVVGDFKYLFLQGINPGTLMATFTSTDKFIPVMIFVMFQCMFAVITPALIIGGFAERFKFSSFLVFIVLWELIVYVPMAHMVWNANGWLYKLGALDFAGGTVVHINAGIAALVAAIFLGKRKNLKPMPPHNLPFTLIGAAMLWFGWFGFNAGSGLAADGVAANAFMVTNLATAVAALGWALMDAIFHKKATILGAASGAVAGLVAITPASGYVDAFGAIVIGLVTAVVCFLFVVFVKGFFKYDDSLDAFGVHAIGGMIGAILTGIFANPVIFGYKGTLYGNPDQLWIQLTAVGFTIVFSAVLTFLILGAIKLAMGLRVSDQDEAIGLDISQHSERAYTVIE